MLFIQHGQGLRCHGSNTDTRESNAQQHLYTTQGQCGGLSGDGIRKSLLLGYKGKFSRQLYGLFYNIFELNTMYLF